MEDVSVLRRKNIFGLSVQLNGLRIVSDIIQMSLQMSVATSLSIKG